MEVPTTLEGLTELLRKLGAPHPEKWASSQLKERIPQLQRFLFLREAWKQIIPDNNHGWMDSEIRRADAKPEAPYSGVGVALKNCLALGVQKDDLKEIVRGKQAQLLFALCQILDDPDLSEQEVKKLSWSLFQTDEEGNPLTAISGLHESVLETDPTGREMRPKTARGR